MSEIKTKLLNVVEEVMLPEVNAYLVDLHKLLVNDEATQDDMNTIKEMESFLVELQNIQLAIKEDKILDEQAQEVYENIQQLIDESNNAHE